ncbi:hypothetical protein [Marinilactibacillus psychrotolerans]|uniref:Uncharacterized protein n=1 Tax=Marinilactibacillus psychrotolerans TaxID=191770 RepID=A0AAV3WSS7_9LACT|nr:hypothetical protein [Marinilactibacillus psychrotolerans]GEL68103.1 hypothetical protein MPS01_22580 [Marinilactibacillus psychrotolerans]GEQ36562.1 hypothetical protein M132T_20700 [Marinilactibacillus psychrotolerans]SDD40685.1 hypothetical protein SAMN04488013_13013 [Marinilactibacillus psychrotolerans]
MNEKNQGVSDNSAGEVDYFNDEFSSNLYSGPESLIHQRDNSGNFDHNPFADMTDDYLFD